MVAVWFMQSPQGTRLAGHSPGTLAPSGPQGRGQVWEQVHLSDHVSGDFIAGGRHLRKKSTKREVLGHNLSSWAIFVFSFHPDGNFCMSCVFFIKTIFCVFFYISYSFFAFYIYVYF